MARSDWCIGGPLDQPRCQDCRYPDCTCECHPRATAHDREDDDA